MSSQRALNFGLKKARTHIFVPGKTILASQISQHYRYDIKKVRCWILSKNHIQYFHGNHDRKIYFSITFRKQIL
jgi:hypothetical protein